MSSQISPNGLATLHQSMEGISDYADPSSFELRAHHLGNIASFIKIGVNEFADTLIATHGQAEDALDGDALEEDRLMAGMAYVADIFGETETFSERPGVVKRHQEVLDQYLALPDEASVRLTKLPDKICAACVGGKHCELGQYDWLAMESFMRRADDIARSRGEQTGTSYSAERDEYGNLNAVTTTKKVAALVVAQMIHPPAPRRNK